MLEDFKQMEKVEFDPKPFVSINIDCTETIKELNKYINKLNELFKKDQNNFAELCYYVREVRLLFCDYDKTFCGELVSKKRESYRFDDIMKNFGIDETQSSRLLSCATKFVEVFDGKPKIKNLFFGFSKSKLFELLTVPDEQLESDINNNLLRSDMTVVSIRQYVKNYKAMKKVDKKLLEMPETKEESYEEPFDESSIEMAYDPSKHYEFEYFEKKSKSQLLNIVVELQKYVEKLKQEKKKK